MERKELDIRVKTTDFEPFFDLKCPLVLNYINMTDSRTLSTDHRGHRRDRQHVLKPCCFGIDKISRTQIFGTP